ncbi:MAG: choline kinase [Colwellia sp.]|jgi:choline kinase
MKAIILAAGEGKRLRPLTDNTPKSLVKIWGKSLLERQLEQLKSFGIENITVVTGFCKEKIEGLGIHTVFNAEYNSTNMVFSLSKTVSNLQSSKDKETLILYGDIAYCDSHLEALIEASSDAPMSVLGNVDWFELWSQRLDDPLTDAETFQFDSQFKLLDIGKVPRTIEQVQAQYMGMIKVDTPFLISLLNDYIKVAVSNNIRNLYMTDLVQQVVDINHVNVLLVSGSWIEIDTIEDYQLYAQKTAYDFGL